MLQALVSPAVNLAGGLVEFGVALPNFKFGADPSPEHILGVAETAEECGYTSVMTSDHILVGTEYPRYGNLYESLITLTWIAARTERIRIGTSILVLPIRNALLAAKQLATLDAFAGGRVIVGVGVGWNEQEYGFVGAPFRRRGRLLDESIRVLRNLWNEERPAFRGDFYKYDESLCDPKPARAGGPPIWVGGNSEAAIKRAAAVGDAWHGDEVMPDDFARGIEQMRELAREHGREAPTATVRFTVDLFEAAGIDRASDEVAGHYMGGESEIGMSGSFDRIRDFLRRYRDLGTTDFICQFEHDTPEQHAQFVRIFADEVMDKLATS